MSRFKLGSSFQVQREGAAVLFRASQHALDRLRRRSLRDFHRSEGRPQQGSRRQTERTY